jgi:hypothetical protein
MNLTAGQSSKKEHLSNGSRTACNRKTSGIGAHSFDSFKWWAEKYPDSCCQKCLNKFYENQNRLLSKKQ